MASATKETLNLLFPLPATSLQPLAPVLTPGQSADSAEALVEILKENHKRFHIFFNDRGFHNHATHHLYAIYSMGASKPVLQAAFKSHADYLKDAFDSPGDITDSNWMDHFGDEKYYQAYAKFFAEQTLKDGMAQTVEKFVFDVKSNWVNGLEDAKQPQMLNRLLSGVLHPFIHVGYGFEFNSPGMVVEGLSMACVTHGTDFDVLLPESFFTGEKSSTLSSLVSALSLSGKSSANTAGAHSFDIVARMLSDAQFAPGAACKSPSGNFARPATEPSEDEEGLFPMKEVLRRKGEEIRKYASEWVVDAQNKKEVEKKVEEMFVFASLLYGVAGLQSGKDFKADFFLMHLVTSSLFLPSFAAHLQPSSLSQLLHSYFASALTVWVARGRPAPQVTYFYGHTQPSFHAPGPAPTPGPDVLAPEDANSPNPWMQVMQSTLVHPNEHLPKAIRSLSHFAHLLGTKPTGTWADKSSKLEGAEKLDGTLFVRIASLTMDHLGWVREGQEKKEWDFTGFWL